MELHFPPSPFFSAASNLHFMIFFFNRLELTQMWQQRSPWSSKGSSCSCPCVAWSPGPGSWSTSPWWTPPWIQSPSLPARGVGLLQFEKNLDHPTSLIDMIDLSLFESLSSRAMTTQFAMMVMMMIHSKGGQLTWNYIFFAQRLFPVLKFL